tara:strand:+ start:2744 stop:3130 length:387 start_codon:yes stop_codon:yes gene_type:complete
MRHYSRGFTLIELLVVVALIGILSAIGVVSYGKYKTSAEKKQAEISLNSIYLAQQEYRSNNGEYCTNDCNSQSKIITELFDGVDDLSDQNYQFKVNNRSNGFEAEAKHKTSNCTIKLNEKNQLTKSNC